MPKPQEFQIKGSFNYHIDFQIKGTAPFQSCILIVNAFSKPDKKYAIPCKCQWSRIRGSRTYNLLGINSNTYQLSAQDIGSLIEIEVSPQEEGFKGKATIYFGPVILDPQIKVTLEGILAAGGSKFPITLMVEDTGALLKESSALLLTNDNVRLVINASDREEKSIKFRYNLEEPEIEMNNLDTTLLALTFRGSFEEDMPGIMRFLHENRLNTSRICRFSLKTVSKTSRDLIYLSLKCFAAKRFLLDSKLISSIESLFSEGKLFSNAISKSGGTFGDVLLEVEGLKKEVNFLLKSSNELANEKEGLSKEIVSLEKELNETIEAYSQMIMELKTSGNFHNESVMLEMSMVGRKDELYYRNEVKKLNDEKKKLIEKISVMNEELELNRHFNKNEGFFSESRIWATKNDDEKFAANNNSRILSTPPSNNKRDLEAALMNISELKSRNAQLEKQLVEYKQIIDRNSSSFYNNSNSNSNLKILENKLQETKKLNEMLLAELNEKKQKNEQFSLTYEDPQNNILKQQYQKKCSEFSQIEAEKNILYKEHEVLKMKFSTMEAELHECRKKVTFLENNPMNKSSPSEIYSRFEQERSNLNNEIFSLRAKTNKQELDINESQRKAESLESQLRTLRNKCETLELENQVFRKETESLKYHGKSSLDDREEKIKMADSRYFELKSKYDLLLAENENLKFKLAELPNKSFFSGDFMNKDADIQLKSENERLRNEINNLTRPDINLQDHKVKSLQKLLEEARGINEKNLKEILQLKRENQELRSEIEMIKKSADNRYGYNSQKLNDTSFMLNRTITYELENENESLKHKLTSLELMLSDYKTKFALLQGENDNLKKEMQFNSGKKLQFSQEIAETELLKSRLATNELLINDYKKKLENAYLEINSLKNENTLLKSEIEELSKQKGKLNVSTNEILNRSFRDHSSLNRTFQMELEIENESLKKNMTSLENMLQDYKNNIKTSYEKNLTLEQKNNELLMEIHNLKTMKTNPNNASILHDSFENKQLMSKIEGLQKEIKENNAIMENFKGTNQRLMTENQRLMDIIRKTQDEMDGLKSRSRIMDASFMGDGDVFALKEKIADLQRENEIINNEKDKLLVELSKLMAQHL